MKRKKVLTYGIGISIFLFILAAILFNDVSFSLLGLGIVIFGITIMLYINKE